MPKWIGRFISIGYAAKGSLYLLLGILAVRAALNPGKEAAGTRAALEFLLRVPLGRLFLGVLAIALIGYVLERFIRAAIDPGHSDSLDLKRIALRVASAFRGMIYLSIAGSAFNMVVGKTQSDDPIEDLANQLFERPLGEWALFLGGIVVVGVGVVYLYIARTASHTRGFDANDIDRRLKRLAGQLGTIGIAARGIAFVAIGIFLMRAALFARVEAAGGLKNALRLLEDRPLGSLWLGLVGAGFISYGLYMYFVAKYRQFRFGSI